MLFHKLRNHSRRDPCRGIMILHGSLQSPSLELAECLFDNEAGNVDAMIQRVAFSRIKV